eukprot:scpid97519/ scgid22235/ 
MVTLARQHDPTTARGTPLLSWSPHCHGNPMPGSAMIMQQLARFQRSSRLIQVEKVGRSNSTAVRSEPTRGRPTGRDRQYVSEYVSAQSVTNEHTRAAQTALRDSRQAACFHADMVERADNAATDHLVDPYCTTEDGDRPLHATHPGYHSTPSTQQHHQQQ